jgi:hypothetical protein
VVVPCLVQVKVEVRLRLRSVSVFFQCVFGPFNNEQAQFRPFRPTPLPSRLPSLLCLLSGTQRPAQVASSGSPATPTSSLTWPRLQVRLTTQHASIVPGTTGFSRAVFWSLISLMVVALTAIIITRAFGVPCVSFSELFW